ncbi:MAG TPA: hypothetical protein VHR97_14730 [Candidatus Baltobacteraceae bacterium]|jgi:transcriptional regulator with XRE-family HTH domain|nr:hypothetical protein [Candidatus Baltobacteraceae bacterium]
MLGLMAEKTTFWHRLAQAMTDAGLGITRGASIMGVTEKQMRRYLDGTSSDPKLSGALRLCEELNINPWWLAFAKEPKQLRDGAERAALVQLPAERLEKLETQAIRSEAKIRRLQAALKRRQDVDRRQKKDVQSA